MGGHEWVLLFYPDGKRSSSSEAGLGGGVGAVVVPPPGPGNFEGAPPRMCLISTDEPSQHHLSHVWRTGTRHPALLYNTLSPETPPRWMLQDAGTPQV